MFLHSPETQASVQISNVMFASVYEQVLLIVVGLLQLYVLNVCWTLRSVQNGSLMYSFVPQSAFDSHWISVMHSPFVHPNSQVSISFSVVSEEHSLSSVPASSQSYSLYFLTTFPSVEQKFDPM